MHEPMMGLWGVVGYVLMVEETLRSWGDQQRGIRREAQRSPLRIR